MNPSVPAINTTTPHSKPLKKGNWLPAEDEQLREGVAKHGTRWVLVAGEVGTRNGDQCAKRWKDKLSPDLDHSPWTREEENQLLELVNRYGRNWKFMADFYLEARAPLALKNRHALLMRRLKRQGSGSTESNGNPEIPAALVFPLHDTAPQTINDIVESANALMDGTSSGLVISTSPRNSAHSTISLRNGISPAVETITADFPQTENLGPAQSTCKGTAISWTGENFDWQQLILDSMMDVDGLSDPTITNSWAVTDISNMAVVESDGPRPSSSSDSSESSSSTALRSQADSRSSDSMSSITSSKVKFSVTCQRGKLKSIVKHMVDAAMAESADLATEQDQVTLTLQLKG